MEGKMTLTRRDAIRLAGAAAAGVVLAACAQSAPAPPPSSTAKPASTTAPSTAATAAPAAPARAEVQELRLQPQHFATAGGGMFMLDPARWGMWSFWSLLWTPLVAGDTAGNPVKEKSLAESWEVSGDGKAYTFSLRQNAKYSDGSSITAQDVADCFGYYAMLTHPQAQGFKNNFAMAKRLLFDIVGLLEVAAKATYDEFGIVPVPGIKVVNERTLQINLMAPSDTFIKRLTAASSGIFRPKDMLAGKTASYDLLDYWPAHAVSSGQYKIAEAVPGQRVVMVPNEQYFGPKPGITKITCRLISSDVNTQLTAFANKEIDLLPVAMSGDAVRQSLKDPYLSQSLVEVPHWQIMHMWITPNAPLDDVHVRRAFSMAVNKEALVRLLNAGADRPLFRTVNTHRNPGVPHCEAETAKVTPLPYDPAKAREELKLSKYGAGVVDTEIHMLSQQPEQLPTLEATQKMLQENLGLKKVTIHTEKVPDLTNPPFPLHLWLNMQMPFYPDLSDTLRNMVQFVRAKEWEPQEKRSYVSVSYVPKLKQLVESLSVEQNPSQKCGLIGEAMQVWNDDVFSMDYAVAVQYYLIAPWVKDIEWHGNAAQGKPLDFEKVWVAKR